MGMYFQVYVGPVIVIKNANRDFWVDDVIGNQNLAQIRYEERRESEPVYLVSNVCRIGRSFGSDDADPDPEIISDIGDWASALEIQHRQELDILTSKGYDWHIETMIVPYCA